MVRIPGGTFLMGKGGNNYDAPHEVTVASFRGGSWDSDSDVVFLAAHWAWSEPGTSGPDIGFRCAR